MAKILVVEDDLANLEIIVRFLKISKFDVVTAADRAERDGEGRSAHHRHRR